MQDLETTLTSKGQGTIPLKIRRLLLLGPDNRVHLAALDLAGPMMERSEYVFPRRYSLLVRGWYL
jgi:bifunctional DNA-binding transcriptional regulator/antitoxin component of YhaV-PrlF toxin-antitoxin module